MKTLVKKTEKKEMKNFVILKTKELVKIKGGESISVDIEII
jgi:hypothetical protein